MSKKLSVTGLQNIGMLMERGQAQIKTPRVEKPFEPEEKRKAIVAKTVTKLSTETAASAAYLLPVIKASVKAAYDAGHDDALAQNTVVEEMLAKQYQDRSANLVPAVVAAVMEQLGMTELVLDLSAVATVFLRTRLEFDVAHGMGDTPDVATYRLQFNGDAS